MKSWVAFCTVQNVTHRDMKPMDKPARQVATMRSSRNTGMAHTNTEKALW
jgi:hypothetical protein